MLGPAFSAKSHAANRPENIEKRRTPRYDQRNLGKVLPQIDREHEILVAKRAFCWYGALLGLYTSLIEIYTWV